jgi:tetratricopeptide (TPR) repeat protein/predicted Ser/Thr protein kinase
MACVDDTTILAYFRGELPAGEVAAISDELDRCDSCRELMMAVASAWRADEGALGDQRKPGASVGRYVIESVLGAGAMGVVYAAKDPELDRTIALKVMARPSPQMAERFRKEAQAMARLDHRNVVPVYDVGGEGPEAFVAMALVRGVTLREWLKKERTVAQIADAFAQAADGLAEAHARGIVHRDFKPENVLVGDDGVVRVSDFGLAVLGAPVGFAEGSPEQTGAAGTPAYLAPEVKAGGAGGPRADQYSFWVALHEAVMGERPAASGSPVAGRKLPNVPRRLSRAMTRGLADDPAARFGSMADVATELRAMTGGRRRTWIAIAAVGAAALGIGGFMLMHGGGDSCVRAAADLDALWPARSAQVRGALAAAPRPYAAFTADSVVASLDRYASAWRASAVSSCRARDTQSADLIDRRSSCLAERRAALEAVLARVGDPKAIAEAVDLVEALPAVAICDDVATLAREPVPPRDPKTVQQIAAVRAQIAAAKTSFAAGTFAEGLRVARDATAAARATGHRPLVAEALEIEGGLTSSSGKPEDALALLDEGLREAEASGAVHAALAIRLRESEVLGALDKRDEALRVAKLGLATAESANVPATAADFDVEIGVLESDAGHNDVAIAAYRKGLALLEKEKGPDSEQAGHVAGLIGLVEDDLGKHDDAIRDITRALDSAGRTYGKAHPNYANALSNLASHTSETDPKHAYELAKQAHSIRVAALDPDHPELAMSWSNLGGMEQSLGMYAEAKADLDKALAIKLKVFGPEHPSVGVTHLTLSQVLLATKDLPGSLDHAERAVAIFAKALGDDHLYTATARAHLGSVLLEVGRPADAIAPLEAALPHLAQSPDLHRYQFNLADALAKTHRDPARVKALATEALAVAEKKGDKLAIEAIRKLLR